MNTLFQKLSVQFLQILNLWQRHTYCGACSRVCPATQRLPGKDWKEGTYYAMWAKKPAERQTGSSGGIFGLLADEVLKQNGVVFGTVFSDDYKSVYVTSTEQVSLEALKKSKYVEGKTGTVFKDVKRCLEQGETCPVLWNVLPDRRIEELS